MCRKVNMENRYNNGKIYRIVCNVTGLQYIGSTCLPTLAKRLAYHRNRYNSYLGGKDDSFITSFEILKNNDYEIILIEEYKCETKDQLFARERYHIENNNCVNKYIPGRTKKEYKKMYIEKNKELIKEKDKEYREKNKEQIKERKKEYKEKNKEQIKEKDKEYREKNKEQINEKFTCECSGKYTYANKSQHFNSIKHQNYLNNQKENV
jgi:hypothetical protein